jgi:hypothetical protein
VVAQLHSFDPAHAAEFGVEAAIVIHSFTWWIDHNRANGRNQVDGRTWTYNSYSALAKLFPYLTYDQVRRTMERLVVKGVLVKAQHSLGNGKAENWYAFQDEARFLPPLAAGPHLADLPDGLANLPDHLANLPDAINKETVSAPVKDPVEGTPLPPREPSPGPARRPQSRGAQAVYSLWLKVRGWRELQDPDKRLNRSAARTLAEQGYTPDQVVRCLQWLQMDPWFQERGLFPTLPQIVKNIGAWVAKGEPEENARGAKLAKRQESLEEQLERLRRETAEAEAAGLIPALPEFYALTTPAPQEVRF